MFGICKIFRNAALCNVVKTITYTQFIRYKSKDTEKENFERQFIIVRVAPPDYEKVLDIMRHSFFNGEPTIVAAGLAYKYNPILENKILECLTQGMSLMAKCRLTGNIVGAAINSSLCPWDPDLLDNYANTCTCSKVAEVLRFYAHVSRVPNLWERFHEIKLFEISYLTTDASNQGKGIGQHLVKKSLDLGKDLGFNVIRIDATSSHTQKICKKLNMNMVHEILYKSYVDCNGKPVFLPPPPHESVQVFVYFPHATPEQLRKLK